jgi:hypothetical protein
LTLLSLLLVLASVSAAASNPVITSPPPNSGPAWSPGADPTLAESGFVEEEFFIEGTATAYTAATPLSSDGRWAATPGTTAPYKTRILVRRPADAKRFNGTVVVEWLNVTAGTDSAPDWTFPRREILRSGYAWVGVSAQWVGVESPNPPPFPGAPRPLIFFNPARYGTLTHPGDSYSYDIFSQAGQALRSPNGPNPLGDAPIAALLAAGESQSAGRMVTYVNAVHPVAGVYDGFLVHSRSGGAAPLSQVLKAGTGSPASPGPTPAIGLAPGVSTLLRSDLATPVFVLQTETDIPGSVLARRADDASFRLWELTGTAHADAYILTGGIDEETITESICDLSGTPAIDTIPVNAGPHTYSARAALHHLNAWVREGVEPPVGDRITTVGNVIQRDAASGIALGGIRLPQIAVPKWTLRGDRGPGGNFFCFLFGRTDFWDGDSDPWDNTPSDASPTPEPDLDVLYPNHGSYVSQFKRATNKAVKAGFVLKADRQEITQKAVHAPIGRR